ncbi:hypothetical protein LA080_015772 [Diaporthe eres]|nr:hypothetical protein LA080_015772 [Diaporthe eres]
MGYTGPPDPHPTAWQRRATITTDSPMRAIGVLEGPRAWVASPNYPNNKCQLAQFVAVPASRRRPGAKRLMTKIFGTAMGAERGFLCAGTPSAQHSSSPAASGGPTVGSNESKSRRPAGAGSDST